MWPLQVSAIGFFNYNSTLSLDHVLTGVKFVMSYGGTDSVHSYTVYTDLHFADSWLYLRHYALVLEGAPGWQVSVTTDKLLCRSPVEGSMVRTIQTGCKDCVISIHRKYFHGSVGGELNPPLSISPYSVIISCL